MTRDPIIEELHQIRAQLAKDLNYDVYAIVAEARTRQGQEGRPVVSFASERATKEEPQSVESDQRAA